MNKQQLDWVKAALANNEYASDGEMRADFIQGGLTEAEADEWIAKRSFYRLNIVMQDDQGADVGVFDPHTASIKPLN